VDSELIECVASEPKVCKSLDIPLQHAADPMLKAMGRGMTRTSIERVLHRLREGIPGLVLRTTFIVGFPGETEPLFRELRAFVREARFERLGAFSYSAEEGTLAFGLNHPVPPATARRRLRELMETQHHIAAEIHRGLESKTVAVRVDGFDRLQCLHAGRTQGDAPDVDPTVWVRGLPRTADAIGRVWPVRIEGSSAYDLIGTVEKKR
jgi:ribosomal protein S12 methylthiotransferase